MKLIRFYFILLFVLIAFFPLKAQTFKWAQKMGSTTLDFSRYIAMDNSGNTYTIGAFDGTMIFPGGGSVASRSIVSQGARDIYLCKFDCSRNLVWKNAIGGAGDECGNFVYLSVKYDYAGMLYITGTFSATATLTTTSGSPASLVSAGGTDIFTAKYDTTGKLIWAIGSGGTQDDEGTDLCLDHSGHLITCGLFKGSSTFKTMNGSNISKSSDGSNDLFIAKYSTNGDLIWVSAATGPAGELATSVAVDNSDNIYTSVCSFGASTLFFGTHSVTNTGNWGAYAAKANSSGNWVWANGMGTSIEETTGRLVVDNDYNVFIIVHFQGGNSVFTSTPPGSSVTLTNKGSYDVGMVSMDSAGVVRWGKSVGGTGTDYGWHVIVGLDGTIIYSGTYSTTANFGNGFSKTSAGGQDGFLAFINPLNGTTLGVVNFGGPGDDAVHAATPDNVGNIYLGGYFNNTAAFGPFNLTSTGSYESFIAKLAPINTFLISFWPTDKLCAGDSTFLFPTYPENFISCQWLNNNIPISGEVNDTLKTKSAGTYRLVYYNICNESDTSQPITITSQNISVNVGIDRVVCLGDSFQFHASGAINYLWSPSTYLDNSGLPNVWCKPTDSVTYIVKGTTGSCLDYDTVNVKVTKVAVSAGSNQTICFGDSVQLNATVLGNFVWSPAGTLSNPSISNPIAKPLSTTTYIITSSQGACVASDSVTIFISDTTTIYAGADVVICNGDKVQLNATGGQTFLWKPFYAISDSSIANPFVYPSVDTSYIVESGGLTCMKYDTVRVTVNPLPIVDAGIDQLICVYNSGTFIGSASGADTYSWFPTNGLSDASVLSPIVNGHQKTMYYLTASNSITNCKATDSVLFIPDSVVAKFTATPLSGISPLLVNFTNASLLATKYNWIFDSTGASSTLVNPTYTYAYQGSAHPMLIAQNNNGCVDTFQLTIDLFAGQVIHIPNVFTPNGDNVNDEFVIHVMNPALMRRMKGSIWNRWGQKLYEWTMPGGKWWNGWFEGKTCQDDVYVYIIDVEDIYGKQSVFKGTVTLLH